MVCILSIVLGPIGRITHVIRYIAYIGLFGTGKCRFIQVLYLGRAPRTKETLPDFREKCRVTRHSRVFRELTGSQRTPGFWGVTELDQSLLVWLSLKSWPNYIMCFMSQCCGDTVKMNPTYYQYKMYKCNQTSLLMKSQRLF